MTAWIIVALLGTAEAAPTCEQTKTYTAASGSFTDGTSARELYANSLYECYEIAAGESTRTLHFKRMQVEARYDYVSVYDGNGKLIDDEATTEDQYYSTTGFTLVFQTDYSTRDFGWEAVYGTEMSDEEDRLHPEFALEYSIENLEEVEEVEDIWWGDW